jgi:hypothetical protein
MRIHREDTAIVFIDPQNEVLSEKGSAWPLVRESLQENNTIENMERIFKAAKAHGFGSSFLLTISIPRTKDGNSTDRSKPMRLPQVCSRAKES